MSQNLRHKADHVIYREEQRFTQWWIRLMLIALAAYAWWAFFKQIIFDEPFGNNPGPDWLVWLIFIAIGGVVPVFMLTMKMVTTVSSGSIEIRFSFFHKRRISTDSIVSFEARQYRPLIEYGGWGIRWRPGKGMAYSTSGNRGVELKLSNGKLLMIGSQEEKKLARAVEQAIATTH